MVNWQTFKNCSFRWASMGRDNFDIKYCISNDIHPPSTICHFWCYWWLQVKVVNYWNARQLWFRRHRVWQEVWYGLWHNPSLRLGNPGKLHSSVELWTANKCLQTNEMNNQGTHEFSCSFWIPCYSMYFLWKVWCCCVVSMTNCLYDAFWTLGDILYIYLD